MNPAVQRQHHPNGAQKQLVHGLGWLSIGLGVAQIVAPRRLARTIGISANRNVCKTIRMIGLREIASGIGILTRPRPSGWLWARVGGDVMDVALLGSAFNSRTTQKHRAALATTAVVGVTALDVLASEWTRREPDIAVRRSPKSGVQQQHVKKQITINAPPQVVYAFWRNFENLPQFMHHLESVQIIDERRSRWKAKALAGKTIQWEAEIIEDRPDELIAWRSLEGADVPNSGTVRFDPAPGGNGTVVRVELTYGPPGWTLGVTVAKLFGKEPAQQVDSDLRRFKQVIEVGEVVHSDASIHRGLHSARPPEHFGGTP